MGLRIWLMSLGLALALHALGFSMQWPAKTASFSAVGVGEEGIEIGLGQTGSYQDQLQQQTVAEPEPAVEPPLPEAVPRPVEKPVRVKPEPTQQPVTVKVEATQPTTEVQYSARPQQEVSPPPNPAQQSPTNAAIAKDTTTNKPQPSPDALTLAKQAQTGRNQRQATGYGNDRSAGGKVGDARSYYAQLMAWLNRYKRYPSQAKKAKQQGVVHILFTLNRNGDVVKRSIKKSSGSTLLDQAALDMFDSASPLPPIPDHMQRQQLSMVLPVDFSLITNNAFKE